MKLTVFWDESMKLWVGIVEREESNRLQACRHLFGDEPKDAQVLSFVHHEMMALMERSRVSVESIRKPAGTMNPKRLARQAARELARKGVSSYAQDAVKKELEARKRERQVSGRLQQEQLAEWKRERRIQKSKDKHRGR
ncbi:YjdF family protein [Paenibacillus kobensis]|uniref:YjdF family protein n=1 Tax=Paenibacillus kobensis TaxID=59841 RepID=UPI000FD6C304|nr:YjdF family protein [Paenibacillus kobensis]